MSEQESVHIWRNVFLKEATIQGTFLFHKQHILTLMFAPTLPFEYLCFKVW